MYQKISWSAQLIAARGLFGVSFLLQALVLGAFLGSPLLGFAVAATLEASKVLAIILYRILRAQQEVAYPQGVRIGALVFRAALLGLSAACSVMYLAAELDRPGLEQTRGADLAAAERDHRTALAALASDSAARRAQASAGLQAQSAAARDDLRRRFEPGIKDLEQRLLTEMDNLGGGTFKGPRYREFTERLAADKAAWSAALAELADRDATRRAELLAAETQTEARRRALEQAHAERIAAIRADDYLGDARAEHPAARAVVSVLSAVLDRPIGTLHFAFWFSLFLAVTLELGIAVSFEHLTLARLPVFQAERRSELGLHARHVSAEAELQGFAVDEAVQSEKLRRRRQRIEDDLRGFPRGNVANDDPPPARMRQ